MAEIKVFKPTSEQIEKAKAATSTEELLALARAANIELSQEAANKLFERLHPAKEKISIDDLDDIAGGCDDDNDEGPDYDIVDAICPVCGAWGPEYEGCDFQGRTCCYCHNCGHKWHTW